MAGAVLNRIIIVGRVENKPEVVFGNDAQTSRVKFTLKVQRPQFSPDVPVASDDIPIIFFGRTADEAAEQIAENGLILVEGSIYTRQTTSAAGTTLYLTEVNGRNFVVMDNNQSAQKGQDDNQSDGTDETIDDVPF